jgi:hypothetical protein
MAIETIAPVLYAAAAGGLLIAQAAGGLPEGVSVEGLTPLGSIGFAVWYGWYVTSRAFPHMNKQHCDERAAASKQHAEERKADSERWMELFAQERAYHNEQAQSLRERVHEMADKAMTQTLLVTTAVENLAKLAGMFSKPHDPQAAQG